MKKQNRLLKNSDFQKVIRNGKKIYSKNFSVYYCSNNDNIFRVGTTISKKVSKLAVTRNLIKRRITAALNTLNIPLDLNLDVVVIAKPLVCGASYQEILHEISSIFQKIM